MQSMKTVMDILEKDETESSCLKMCKTILKECYATNEHLIAYYFNEYALL